MKKCILFSLLLCILCGVVSFAVEGMAVVAKEETIEIVDGAIDFNKALFRYDLSRYVNVRNNAAQLSYQPAENSLEQCEILITSDNIMELRPLVATKGMVKIDVFSDGQYACSLNFNVEYVNMTTWLVGIFKNTVIYCMIILVLAIFGLLCNRYAYSITIKPQIESGEFVVQVSPWLKCLPIPWFLIVHQAAQMNTDNKKSAEEGKDVLKKAIGKGWFFSKGKDGVCFIASEGGCKKKGSSEWKKRITFSDEAQIYNEDENESVIVSLERNR